MALFEWFDPVGFGYFKNKLNFIIILVIEQQFTTANQSQPIQSLIRTFLSKLFFRFFQDTSFSSSFFVII